jgi:hypothetical protein
MNEIDLPKQQAIKSSGHPNIILHCNLLNNVGRWSKTIVRPNVTIRGQASEAM